MLKLDLGLTSRARRFIESVSGFHSTLLEKAFQKASKPSSVTQNSLAKWLLEEMEDEKKCETQFAESEDILEKLANDALDSDNNGK